MILPLRLVLDTNVVVSALLFETSSIKWIRSLWQSGGIIPLISHDTRDELLRVLISDKFGLTLESRALLLEEYLPRCEMIMMPDPRPAVPVCRDPSDTPFLELAAVGQADFLVTGDNDLLAIAPQFSIPIITPAALRQRLAGSWNGV